MIFGFRMSEIDGRYRNIYAISRHDDWLLIGFSGTDNGSFIHRPFRWFTAAGLPLPHMASAGLMVVLSLPAARKLHDRHFAGQRPLAIHRRHGWFRHTIAVTDDLTSLALAPARCRRRRFCVGGNSKDSVVSVSAARFQIGAPIRFRSEVLPAL